MDRDLDANAASRALDLVYAGATSTSRARRREWHWSGPDAILGSGPMVKDDVMLTVVGAATAKELVSVAESLQHYPAGPASPDASPTDQ